MSRADKLLERMRVNPAGDWTIDDVRTICERHGLIVEAPRRGSHFTIRVRGGTYMPVPARRPIKPVYIREVVKLVSSVIDNGDGR